MLDYRVPMKQARNILDMLDGMSKSGQNPADLWNALKGLMDGDYLSLGLQLRMMANKTEPDYIGELEVLAVDSDGCQHVKFLCPCGQEAVMWIWPEEGGTHAGCCGRYFDAKMVDGKPVVWRNRNES